jgi:hypothetical protein
VFQAKDDPAGGTGSSKMFPSQRKTLLKGLPAHPVIFKDTVIRDGD